MYGKMQDSGLREIISWPRISAIWGQYPALSHPESPQGASLRVAAAAKGSPLSRSSIPTGLTYHPSGLSGLMAASFVY